MEAFDARALRAALNRMETPPRRSRLSRRASGTQMNVGDRHSLVWWPRASR